MIYNNIQCFENASYFDESDNLISYPRLVYQEFRLKLYSKIRNKNYELENELVSKIEYINQLYFDLFSQILDDFENLIIGLSEDESLKPNLDGMYVNCLTHVETKLDESQFQLIKIKSILDRKYFRYNKNSRKIDSLLKGTNRNLNLIIRIREKIDTLDDMTNNMRFYTEVNRKYKKNCGILLGITIFNFVLFVINWAYYPRIISIGIGFLSLAGYVGMKYGKHRINSSYFKERKNYRNCGNI